ncbi:MAG: ABC transporter ATP-binding protein, partial [Dehalococcoidia bacterium]
MAYWAGGGAAGWSGDGLPGGRPRTRSGRIDGWDYEELGKIYDFPLLARLGPFFAPYKIRAAIAVVMMVIASVTSYVQPFIMGKGVERLVANLRTGTPESLAAATADVRNFGAWLVGISILSFVATYIQRRMTGYMGHGLLKNLRSKMFDHLNRLSLSFYDNQEVGRVMSRVTSDVVTLQELMTTGFLNVLADLVGLALVVFFLLALDVQLGLISLAVIPVLMVFLAVWQGYAARAFIRTRIAIAMVNSNLNENVSGVRVVQALRRERENLAHFDRLNEENLDANLDAARQQAIVMPVVEVLSSLATVLVLVVIGIRTFNGDLDPSKALGFSTAFLLYIQRVFNPVRDIVLQYTQLQRAMAGARRIFEVLDTQPEIEDIPDAVVLPDVRGRVDFNHVQFEYVPGVPVLRDFDLHVEPGETVALVGHTGAGKTSVTALVNRSYEITGGQILIDGTDLGTIERASLTSRMSVVLQEPYLFSGTVRENIRYGKLDATDAQMRAAA